MMPTRPSHSTVVRSSVAVVAVLVACAGWLAWHVRRPEVKAKRAREMLVEAVGGRRPVLPRLTGGFTYSPPDTAGRGLAANAIAHAVREIRHVAGPEADAVRGALHLLTAAGRENPATPFNAEAEGTHRAITRTASRSVSTPAATEHLDAAILAFQKAVEAAPDDPANHIELGAALLVRGTALDDPRDLIDAQEVLGRAIVLDSDSEEARFNYALALGSLFLWSQEREAWEAYLEVDNRSGWAVEARGRLEEIDQLERGPEEWHAIRDALRDAAEEGATATLVSLVAAHPQLARELGERELLPAWGEALLAGQTEDATHTVTAALRLGKSLSAFNGDRLLLEAAQAATAGGESLARGYIAFGAAQPYLERYDRVTALPLLTEASDALTSSNSPLARWVEYGLALCAYWANDHDRATIALSRLTNAPDADHYPSLRSKALRLQGLIQRTWLHLTAAREFNEEALAAAYSSRETEPVASMKITQAIVLDRLGESRAAWDHRMSALSNRGEIYQADRLYLLLAGPADRLVEEGRPATALPFLTEAVRAAEQADDPVLLTDVYRKLAGLRDAAGDSNGAREAIALSNRQIPRIVDADVRDFLEVENLRYEGELLASVDPAAALAALDRAVERVDEIVYSEAKPAVLLVRSRVRRLAGQMEEAVQDLDAAAREIESARWSVANPWQRISFFDQAQAVFEERILLAIERENYSEAFMLADRARGRELIDRLSDLGVQRSSSAGTARGVTPEELLSSLGPNATLVEYGLYGDRSVAWIANRSGFRYVELSASPSRLMDQFQQLRDSATSSNGAALDRALGELFTALITPIAAHVDGSRLIVIPHKDLFLVPFPTLRDSRTGRRLIEQMDVTVAPSAGFMVAAAEREPEPFHANLPTVLVVGDPAFDVRLRPGLKRLRAAAKEAESVARLHPRRAWWLEGTEATREEFSRLAPRADIIHLATHTEIDLENPFASRLVLAGGGSVTSREILDLDLSGVRLVVLSACEAGAGSVSASEGVLSLARAFLAAGADHVIANLWAVEDEETAPLMERLHVHLAAGESPHNALRAVFGDPGNRSEAIQWFGLTVLGV